MHSGHLFQPALGQWLHGVIPGIGRHAARMAAQKPAVRQSALRPTRSWASPRSLCKKATSRTGCRGNVWPAKTATEAPRRTRARSWDRLHPKPTHRSSWAAADGTLPIVEGTVIRLDIDHLSSGATPKPVWLWWSGTDATAADADRLWQAYLRRFDIEHTFRLFKQSSAGPPRRSAPRGSRPMDLADPRRLDPTPARPPTGSRPASTLGETNSAGQTHPRPSPPRLPAHPPPGQLPGPSTGGETANEEVDHPTTTPHGLKIKLGVLTSPELDPSWSASAFPA